MLPIVSALCVSIFVFLRVRPVCLCFLFCFVVVLNLFVVLSSFVFVVLCFLCFGDVMLSWLHGVRGALVDTGVHGHRTRRHMRPGAQGTESSL